MKEITKEIRLDYKNEIGRDGLQTFYRLTEKHEKIENIIAFLSVVWFCLTIFLLATINKNLNQSLVYILLIIDTLSFCICVGLVILQDYESSQYSMGCIFLTEMIEIKNFQYVTACIGVNEECKRYFIFKSYDKDNNLLRQNEISVPTNYEFSDNYIASLTVTNKDWVLVFPKNEINLDTFYQLKDVEEKGDL